MSEMTWKYLFRLVTNVIIKSCAHETHMHDFIRQLSMCYLHSFDA